MPHCIAKTLEHLFRLPPPPRGRHRAGRAPGVVVRVDPQTLVLPRGDDELIPTYMLTAEERRRRRERVLARAELSGGAVPC
ncbi:hypothetical protein [Streptomyces profundus]|uniref:hypothetical protein n=1 Tax=Streptomyces profundus TaxID=2867410 RepID=UPI001D16F40F|nr:hypothetical protein [Streptomyces sp. MA3_2.13]UED85199.1 hypothetical protein K4G22_14165 [Streptomyces sp. MA3_2.13]